MHSGAFGLRAWLRENYFLSAQLPQFPSARIRIVNYTEGEQGVLSWIGANKIEMEA